MPLTDSACRNSKCPEDRPFQRYSDSGGLYLEVTKTGAKLWRWKYRYAGKEKRLALGQYPGVSLASARKARDAAREMLVGGTDPSQARRDARQAVIMDAERPSRTSRGYGGRIGPPTRRSGMPVT